MCVAPGVQRLYSSFANGAAGAGLVLMRAAVAAGLITAAAHTLMSPRPGRSDSRERDIADRPVCSSCLGFGRPWLASSLSLCPAGMGSFTPSDLGVDILLGTLGTALALLGPGAWSVDARLFGWKRVEIRNGNGTSGHDSSPR